MGAIILTIGGDLHRVAELLVGVVRELRGHRHLTGLARQPPLVHIGPVQGGWRATCRLFEGGVQLLAVAIRHLHPNHAHALRLLHSFHLPQRVHVGIGEPHRRNYLHIVQSLRTVEPVRGRESVAAACVDAGEHRNTQHRDDENRQERLPRMQPGAHRIEQECRAHCARMPMFGMQRAGICNLRMHIGIANGNTFTPCHLAPPTIQSARSAPGVRWSPGSSPCRSGTESPCAPSGRGRSCASQ